MLLLKLLLQLDLLSQILALNWCLSIVRTNENVPVGGAGAVVSVAPVAAVAVVAVITDL